MSCFSGSEVVMSDTECVKEGPEPLIDDDTMNFGLRASSPDVAGFIKNLFGL